MSRREIYNFFACLVVVVVNLINQSHFFIKAVVGLAISRAILTGKKVVIEFSRLFLW